MAQMKAAAGRKPRTAFTRRFSRIMGIVTMLAACRVGGPEAVAPTAGVGGPPDSADVDAGSAPMTSADAATSIPEVGADDSGPCEPPFPVEVCDPVCNTGCAALLRCDVSDVPHTGTCVGIWITQEGDPCFKGDGTDACAVGLTCLEGKCARLCYRDDDCMRPGTCCTHELSGPAGTTGFRTCSPCPM
jgi:hypothetical protein